ncbi:hypothetical protein FSARC_12194 [Fusarium sarcochroum]|uniref:Uncharacterized protein n=1 Tax=Fusarium sarcochroum TaxID=1208366 RepID=A0A8H4WXP0_9HYPO|nr:hypothetical protein FSARC_12194 [Fusarium sarcochroum]
MPPNMASSILERETEAETHSHEADDVESHVLPQYLLVRFKTKMNFSWARNPVMPDPSPLFFSAHGSQESCATYPCGGLWGLWWLQILSGGTLMDSNRNWEHGSSAFKAVAQLRSSSKVSLASIIMPTLLIDGPLLQRAVDLTPSTKIESNVLEAALSPYESTQSTGHHMTHAPVVSTVSLQFSQVVKSYTDRSPMRLSCCGCEGICLGYLIAAGVDIDCATRKKAYDLSYDALKPGDGLAIGSKELDFRGTRFPGFINLTTMYNPESTEKGEMTITKCALHLARARYPVRITDRTVTLLTFDMSANRTVAMHSPPNEWAGLGIWPSFIDSIAYAAQDPYASEVVVYHSGVFAIQGSGPLRYMFYNSDRPSLGTFNMTWSDPTLSVIEAIREITFHTALGASNDTYFQSVEGIQQREFTIYVIRGGFLGGALAVILVGVITVGWLFQGFWKIGRQISMSPVEIAAVFQSPVTVDADSNAEVEKLVQEIGNRLIKYGVPHSAGGILSGDMTDEKLAIASPSLVSFPRREH